MRVEAETRVTLPWAEENQESPEREEEDKGSALKPLEVAQPGWHLDLGHLASRKVKINFNYSSPRKLICVVSPGTLNHRKTALHNILSRGDGWDRLLANMMQNGAYRLRRQHQHTPAQIFLASPISRNFHTYSGTHVTAVTSHLQVGTNWKGLLMPGLPFFTSCLEVLFLQRLEIPRD